MPMIQDTIELTVMRCGECGTSHAMPETFRADKERNGGTWYCPNGHPRRYRKSEIQIAREERDEALRKLSAAKCETATERTLREAAEKNLTKAQRRTKHGVCPCCHRTFKQLAAHMKQKHPDFTKK